MTPTEYRNSLFSLFFASELRAWRGQMSLAVVFWGYGVLASLVLVAFHAAALYAGNVLFQQVLILISAAYTYWILVAIWRCVPNADPSWGLIARWLTVTWGLNVAFVLFFLQFELLLRHAGG